MINYLLKKFSKLDFSNGNIVADKSSKFDTLFFVCKFLSNYISTDGLYLDLSVNAKDEITKQIVEVFNKNEDSNGNNNYLSEILNYLQKIDVINKENADKYRIIDDMILQFITTSIENAYICQYISIYDTFVNNDLWNDYIEYTKISIDDENKHASLINISNKISEKSPKITDNNSQWAYQTTMYYLEILGLANDEYGISRNLTIKNNKLIAKDLSANVKGTRSIGEKNDFYLHEFKLKYVQKMLENNLASCNYTKPTNFKRNRIVFGAPGTGKSFKLNNEKDQLVQSVEQYERVTFHPDYTYANFVGTYKPIMLSSNDNLSHVDKEIIAILNDKYINAQEKYDKLYDKFKENDNLTRLPILIGLYDGGDFEVRKNNGEDATKSSVGKNHGKGIRKYVSLISNDNNGNISYEYVPGPFMRLFVKAKKNPNTSYLLLIEEINRANVSAVFGDLFQLLDRDDNEESMYPVEASEDIKKFLSKYDIELEDSKIKIPNNLFIWATMNSADQGVFPMDTAFKRRWDFDYIGIDDSDDEICNRVIKLKVANGYQYFTWNNLRKKINEQIAKKKINEDKQLGPFYISKKIFDRKFDKQNIDKTIIDSEKFSIVFKNKVIMYLFEDVFKSRAMQIFYDFNEGLYRYSDICNKFNEIGIKIFNIDGIDNIFTTDKEKIEDILDKDE